MNLRELLDACLSGERQGWRQFVSQFNRLIQSVILHTLHRYSQDSHFAVDDLVQDVYLRLCAKNYKVLRDFRSPAPEAFYGLLRSVAISVTLDHLRAKTAEMRGGGKGHVPLDEVLDSQESGETHADMERTVLYGQIDQHLSDVSPPETAARDRRIFWLYYRQGFSANDIAEVPGISLSIKGVESLLHRLSTQLRERLAHHKSSAKGKDASSAS